MQVYKTIAQKEQEIKQLGWTLPEKGLVSTHFAEIKTADLSPYKVVFGSTGGKKYVGIWYGANWYTSGGVFQNGGNFIDAEYNIAVGSDIMTTSDQYTYISEQPTFRFYEIKEEFYYSMPTEEKESLVTLNVAIPDYTNWANNDNRPISASGVTSRVRYLENFLPAKKVSAQGYYNLTSANINTVDFTNDVVTLMAFDGVSTDYFVMFNMDSFTDPTLPIDSQLMNASGKIGFAINVELTNFTISSERGSGWLDANTEYDWTANGVPSTWKVFKRVASTEYTATTMSSYSKNQYILRVIPLTTEKVPSQPFVPTEILWTPEVKQQNGTAYSFTYTSQFGRAYVVGKIVHFEIYLSGVTGFVNNFVRISLPNGFTPIPLSGGSTYGGTANINTYSGADFIGYTAVDGIINGNGVEPRFRTLLGNGEMHDASSSRSNYNFTNGIIALNGTYHIA